MRPLAKTTVTPNQVTTVRLLVGLASAACLAVGEVPWWNVGAALFALSVFFDRADGDLARMTGRTSPWGHGYDLISDGICNSVVFVGLGIGLTSSELGTWAVPMGVAAGASVAAILWMVISIESIGGQRAAELKSISGFDFDDAILLVPIAILLGWHKELLIAAVTITPLFTLSFAVMYFKKKNKKSAD